MADRKKLFFERAIAAADWFVNSQIVDVPRWHADFGRFLYYYNMPQKKYVPGIDWTQGRGLFVILDAWKATGDEKYLQAADYAARYLAALQRLDPHEYVTYGLFREYAPQSKWGGTLDGAQAASSLLMLYRATGQEDYLRRGRAFCDFLVRTWRPDAGLPVKGTFETQKISYAEGGVDNLIQQASAMPLWHLHGITGEEAFLPPLVDAADRALSCQRADGAFNYVSDIRSVDRPAANHHWGRGAGDEAFVVLNDDGIVTVILAAWKATGERRFIDAAVRYAEWTISNLPRERPYNAFGIQASNVLDIGKAAGRDWSAWVEANVDKYCLDLQVSGTGDKLADGGFRGEDEENEGGIFGGRSIDYVPTRNTCYMAGLLFRLSGRGTGTGFSVEGLRD